MNGIEEKTAAIVIEHICENIDSFKRIVEDIHSGTEETTIIDEILGRKLFIKFNTEHLNIVEINFLGGEKLGNLKISTSLELVN